MPDTTIFRKARPYLSAPAAGVAAELSLAPRDDKQPRMVAQIVFGYSATPTAGNLSVHFGEEKLLEVDIGHAGPEVLQFDVPFGLASGRPEDRLTIRLAAGGETVKGKLNAIIY